MSFMDQVWTIIFVAVFAVVLAAASLLDREERKRRERREAALEERSRAAASFHAEHVPAGGVEEAAEADGELSAGTADEGPGVREDEREAAHTRG